MGLFTKKEDEYPQFVATFECGNVLFDDNHQLLKANFKPLGIKPNDYIKYEEIMDIDVVEDSNSIKKSGAGGAIGGALLFGPAGAIIGGLGTRGKKKKDVTEKLLINIVLKDGRVKTLYILNSKTKHSSFIYKTAYQTFISVGSKLEDIIENRKTSPTSDIKQQLIEFKELLDLGIITQEEFDQKKIDILKQ